MKLTPDPCRRINPGSPTEWGGAAGQKEKVKEELWAQRSKTSIRHPELTDSVNLGTVIPGLSFFICKMEIKSLISWDYCKDQNRHVLDD